MDKVYVLDTSVLMHDSVAFKMFGNNDVIIPITVLDELDHLKEKNEDDRGFKARNAIKELGKSLDDNDDSVKFCTKEVSGKTNDEKIIDCARQLGGIVVTRDINCRVKAASKGVKVEYYHKNDVKVVEDSILELQCSDSTIDEVYSRGSCVVEGTDLFENQPVILKNNSKSALCYYSGGEIRQLNGFNISGIKAIGARQKYAIHFLMDDSIPLCILEGRPGTGKTLLAIGAGIDKVNGNRYKKIMIAKPTIPVGGNSLGFLPGGLEEKMDPWLGCIKDNLSYLGYDGVESMIFVDSIMEYMSIEHIRGRSLRDCFIIIDETQNINGDVLKTILTRAGENTKVVVCGDLSQIDSLYLDKKSSGLSKLISTTLGSDMVSYVRLNKCIRSKLADYIDTVL